MTPQKKIKPAALISLMSRYMKTINPEHRFRNGESPYTDVSRFMLANKLNYPEYERFPVGRNFCLAHIDIMKAVAKPIVRKKDKVKKIIVKKDKFERVIKNNPSSYHSSKEFLTSYEWRKLRLIALKLHGSRCQCCGASPKDGAVMNVDHIKPRKYSPELALDINNLQVLCGECNHGKGNWDTTDFR